MSNEKELEMERKYEFTDETIKVDGHILHRIRALRDIDSCTYYADEGDLGGYIESEDNLSHDDESWVADNAKVFGDAIIQGNASIEDDVVISGDVVIENDVSITNNVQINNGDRLYNKIFISGEIEISDDVIITGNVKLYGKHRIGGNAKITSNDDILYIEGIGSENRGTTFYKCEDGKIRVVCGCFFNKSLREFEDRVKEVYKDNKYAQEYLHMIEIAKIHFSMKYDVMPERKDRISLSEKFAMIKNVLKM
jgi:acetyltransferase-like isoleucine patch superfamily enzyme